MNVSCWRKRPFDYREIQRPRNLRYPRSIASIVKRLFRVDYRRLPNKVRSERFHMVLRLTLGRAGRKRKALAAAGPRHGAAT